MYCTSKSPLHPYIAHIIPLARTSRVFTITTIHKIFTYFPPWILDYMYTKLPPGASDTIVEITQNFSR
jgi:hypothetical protein